MQIFWDRRFSPPRCPQIGLTPLQMDSPGSGNKFLKKIIEKYYFISKNYFPEKEISFLKIFQLLKNFHFFQQKIIFFQLKKQKFPLKKKRIFQKVDFPQKIFSFSGKYFFENEKINIFR